MLKKKVESYKKHLSSACNRKKLKRRKLLFLIFNDGFKDFTNDNYFKDFNDYF